MSISKFIPNPLAAMMSMADDTNVPELSPEMAAAVERIRVRDMALMNAIGIEIDAKQAVAEFATGSHTLH